MSISDFGQPKYFGRGAEDGTSDTDRAGASLEPYRCAISMEADDYLIGERNNARQPPDGDAVTDAARFATVPGD
jgi:hypothetical protein